MMYYLNEDKTYRQCGTAEWGEQLQKINRHVGDDIINNYRVSTVWLATDHNCCDGPPLLFETMVFDLGSNRRSLEIYMIRYTTWEQAVEGHKKAVQWVLNGCKQ